MIIDLHSFVLAFTRLPHQFKAELTETLAKGGFVPEAAVGRYRQLLGSKKYREY